MLDKFEKDGAPDPPERCSVPEEVGTQENEGRTDFHNLWQTLRWLTKHGSLEALLGEYTSMAISIEHADEQGGMKVTRKGTSLVQKNVTVHEADI